MKRTIAFILFLLFSFTATSHAQFKSGTYSFTPTLGLYTFDHHQRLKSSALAGLKISRYLSPRWAMEAVALYVPTESKIKAGSDNEVSGMLYNIDGLYHFPIGAKWVPYLAAGVGAMTLGGNDTGADTNLILNYGGGIKYLYSEQMAIRADIRQVLVDDGSTEHNMVYTLGLEFFWGSNSTKQLAKSEKPNIIVQQKKMDTAKVPDQAKVQGQVKMPDQEKSETAAIAKTPTVSAGAAVMADADKDGVPDDRDFCANTPLGVVVDGDGCPLDSDGDGTPDYLDKCPGTAKGLITDKNGCVMDTDRDGVADSRDYCANTPMGVPVNEKGCPLDQDGDGVRDALDKCPDTPKGTQVNVNGCPLVIRQKTTTESHIRFETGKSVIRQAFMVEVKRIADYLKTFPEISIEIEGHTDNTGPEKLNTKLSKQRAESLKNALVTHFGISGSRVNTKGYSFKQPIADNNTAEGREKNRRVVVTLYPAGE